MARIFIILLFIFLLPDTMASAQKRKMRKIEWSEVKESAILWHKVVMREFDLTNASNTSLQEMKDSTGHVQTINQLFYNLVKEQQMISSNLAGDTVVVQDSILAFLTKEIKRSDSLCVHKFIIVEEWMFDRDLGRMLVYIRWIGPSVAGYGKAIENMSTSTPVYWKENSKIPCVSAEYQPLFAMRYDELRKRLAQYKVIVDTDKKQETMTAEDYFEKRLFKSKIICVENGKIGR